MIIVATPEGIEIDGILLSNTVEMQAYISAHKPADLSVTAHPVPPYHLEAIIRSHAPEHINVSLYAIPYHALNVYIQPFHLTDFEALIKMHLPYDLSATIGSVLPHLLEISIGGHPPKNIEVSLFGIPYHRLDVDFWIAHHAYFHAEISAHNPYDLNVTFSGRGYRNIQIRLGGHQPKDLITSFRIFHSAYQNFKVILKPVWSGYSDFSASLWGWGTKDLISFIGGHYPIDLSASMHAWHVKDVQSIIGSLSPERIEVLFEIEAEPGFDLFITHGIFRTKALLVNINIWKGLAPLNVLLHGVYYKDFSAVFTMGGHHDFSIDVPMTTGYLDVVVTMKPASRIMTTIIPIMTVEIHDLYISINQGWPWGFNSTYRDFSVLLTPAFFLALNVTLRPIDGSGTDVMGAYINRSNFPTFLNSYPVEFSLPETALEVDTAIVQQLPLRYENLFGDIVEEIIQLRFSWPRIKIFSDAINLSILLVAYKEDLFMDLLIDLYADRADVPKMPTSQPLVPAQQPWQNPVWPEVFQVSEIELWADDPPGLIRKVEVMFGEQAHEYYWVSTEQRAYRKEDFERWTLMTKGYLPHATYSGQLDYVTLYEISDMTKYSTIDAAMTALINSFQYKDESRLEVYLKATGSYNNLRVTFRAWDYNHLSNLFVFVEPTHLFDLNIQFTCVPN